MFWKTGIREYKKFFEDENTRIREYKTLVMLLTVFACKSIVSFSCLLVFLYSIILSPCLLVSMSSSS